MPDHASRSQFATLGARKAAVGATEQLGAAAPDARAIHMSMQAARDLMAAVRTEVAAMQARTVAGLCFKAALVEPETGDHEASRKIMTSIVSDLLALEDASV